MTSNYEEQYQELLRAILLNGKQHQARNGRTVRLFNQQLTADLSKGFPMLTGRRLPWDGIKGELLAFIRGNILLEEFKALGCNFWDKQALTAEDGTRHIGPAYGYTWRQFSSIHPTGPDTAHSVTTDQLAELIASLLTDPGSRRHVLTAWQPNDLDYMALPPCHMMAQWHVEQSPEQQQAGYMPILHCTVTMRSADMFVGVPADMASYALFTSLLALLLGFEPGTVCINMADCHIYEANEVQVETYLQKPCYDLPTVELSQEALRYINHVSAFRGEPQAATIAAIAWLEALEPSDIGLVDYKANDSQTVTMVA